MAACTQMHHMVAPNDCALSTGTACDASNVCMAHFVLALFAAPRVPRSFFVHRVFLSALTLAGECGSQHCIVLALLCVGDLCTAHSAVT